MTDRLDLFGWDTVFAVNYADLNKAIVASKSTPKTFHQEDTEDQMSLDGTWGDWQLITGGDGKNLRLKCPIATGKAQLDADTSIDISGKWVEVQVQLDKVPDPSAAGDPTATGGKAVAQKVKSTGTEEDPAVSLVSSSFTSGIAHYVVPQMFLDWFNANIAEFNHIFAVTVLNAKADQGDYQWLKPTDVSYACADAVNPKLETSVFGALCLTQGRTTSNTPQLSHEIDARLLAGMPTGANSSFAIAPERVLTKLLLPGAINVLQGSKTADFDVINDNLWLTNNKDIAWGNFTLDNGDKVSPVIAKNNFQIGLQDEYVQVSVTDATFNWPEWHGPGNITVHMNYTQQFGFSLQKAKQGYVFVPAPGVGTTSVTSSVVSDKGVLIFDIVMGVASAIALSVIGGIIGGAVGGSASAAVESGTEGAIEITEQGIQRAVTESTEETIQQAQRSAAEGAVDAMEQAANPGLWQKFSSALLANKWKIFGGIVGAVLASPVGLVGDIVKLTAANDLDTIPPFDHFAAACIGSTTFPDLGATWTPLAAGLQGPLVMRGALEK